MPLGSLFKRTLKKKKGASSGIGEAASEAAAPAASDAAAPGTGGTARKRPAAGMSDPVASDLDAIMRAGGSAIVGPEAWRVENLRPSGPPMMTDWWVKESNSADMSDVLPNHSNDSAGVAHLSSQMCCGYDLGGAPSASLDSSERGKKTMPSDAASVTASSSESDDRKSPKIFQNRGFQLWSESRREWRTYADSSSDAKAGRAIQNGNNAMTFAAESEEGESGPSDVNRSPALQGLSTREVEGLLRGMTRVTRTYELPRRIKLPDMVDLLVDVWECED